jgi:hypothetical protein
MLFWALANDQLRRKIRFYSVHWLEVVGVMVMVKSTLIGVSNAANGVYVRNFQQEWRLQWRKKIVIQSANL